MDMIGQRLLVEWFLRYLTAVSLLKHETFDEWDRYIAVVSLSN